ncbi:MAG: carbamoyltransferase HypF [Aquificae bacterium]|nr:carbamoyltransferase HypF [Aquificota bacterium]
MKRVRLKLKGVVQGVGFRPFVHRLATGLSLRGFVLNNAEGVLIEIEGEEDKLYEFLRRLEEEKPRNARILKKEVEFLPPVGFRDFTIRKSEGGRKEALVLPDIATCEDCLREVMDPNDRRYRYPFTNCTNCGPRFTIIERLPYDRQNTTMKYFRMCEDCRREYEDPTSRRFHAQPNACPRCGPELYLCSPSGKPSQRGQKALELALELLREGKIVALKGIGGFHLLCDATNEDAISLLRRRKRRPHKPFAVMFPSPESALEFLELSEEELELLLSPERPIVLARSKGKLPELIAPGLSRVGAFLPYSPLHHILLSDFGKPVVATSANLSGEPIVKDNTEAMEKLSGLCDALVVHNRPIKRRCDDSVVKLVGGIPTPIRRSRGYAPLPVFLPKALKKRVLALGGMLKNTFALGEGDKVILSQHMGDIESAEALSVLEESVFDLMELFGFEPEVIACDLHPRYETTRLAKRLSRRLGIPLVGVQHHFAHALSCMAENALEGEVLAIVWDGTGYGTDGTLWGGEFLRVSLRSFERLYYFRPFPLLGGEKAIREPRRVALSLLLESFGKVIPEGWARGAFGERELSLLIRAHERRINAPLSSSVGRLLDGVSSLLGVLHEATYEGQAPMMLEELYERGERSSYPFYINGNQIDWRPAIRRLVSERDKRRGATLFINTLAEVCLEVARRAGLRDVCLSGGVMQNDPLVSRIRELLEGEGFRVYTHRVVPPNDGGISLGQAFFCGLL